MPDIVTLGAAKASFGISKINNEGSDTQAGKVWTTTQNGAGWSQPVGSAYFDSIQQNPNDETGGKVVGTSFPNVDATLSKQGDAADAKATGDALATKQDAISDLSTIRSGASAGASALPKDPANWPTMTDSQKDTACAAFGAERKKGSWTQIAMANANSIDVDLTSYDDIALQVAKANPKGGTNGYIRLIAYIGEHPIYMTKNIPIYSNYSSTTIKIAFGDTDSNPFGIIREVAWLAFARVGSDIIYIDDYGNDVSFKTYAITKIVIESDITFGTNVIAVYAR